MITEFVEMLLLSEARRLAQTSSVSLLHASELWIAVVYILVEAGYEEWAYVRIQRSSGGSRVTFVPPARRKA